MEYRKPAYRYGFDRGEEVVGSAVWRLPTHGRGKGIAPLTVVRETFLVVEMPLLRGRTARRHSFSRP